jgi:hypothetical protein
MSGAVAPPGREVLRKLCMKHGVEFGMVKDPGIPGVREATWVGNCRDCEADIRREQQAKEEIAAQLEEIKAEAERRFAADTGLEQRIRESAAADLAEELEDEVARFCALRRPQLESEHADREWDRIVGEIEAEKRAEIFEQLKKAR